MGIVRVVEWKLTCTAEEADTRLRAAFNSLGLTPEGPLGSIKGHAQRAILKNRWAADVSVQIQPEASGSIVMCRVDMAGTGHYGLLHDLAEAVGDDAFDDRGLAAAVERMGKGPIGFASRLAGRKEIRHLRNLLRASEEVLEIGQGTYEGRQGLVVMTNERLFFLEKSLGSETLEEFPVTAISSLVVNKDRSGETLKFHASGNQAVIEKMWHGHGDAIVRAFNSAKHPPTQVSTRPAPTAAVAAPDPLSQLERLGELRDKGLVSTEEFEAKKAEILGRL